ncbi:hypothetical protein KIN20_034792, partial [Parelaphostrongylus tenuis]
FYHHCYESTPLNTIIVTPVNTGSGTVDIYVTVTGAQNGRNVTVFERESQNKKYSSSPHMNRLFEDTIFFGSVSQYISDNSQDEAFLGS